MSTACLIPLAECWAVDSLPAGTLTVALFAFAGVSVLVAAAALPGKTRLLLGPSEKRGPLARIGASAFFVLWLAANALVALVLWRALFPAAEPVSLVAYASHIVSTPECGETWMDARCMHTLLAPEPEAGGPDPGPAGWARALLASDNSPVVDAVPALHPVINDDLFAFATALRAPVRRLVLVSDPSGPRSLADLSQKGWPWLGRYLDRSTRPMEEETIEVASVVDCLKTDDVAATNSTRVRFCILPAAAEGRVRTARAYVEGTDLVVEVEGSPLPSAIHVAFAGQRFEAPTPQRPNGAPITFASVRFPNQGELGGQTGSLGVGHAPGSYTVQVSLPLATPTSCLMVEGRSAADAGSWRDSVLAIADLDDERAAALRRLLPVAERCNGTVLYIAANQAIIVGRDQPTAGLAALAARLSPASEPYAFPARVLDPRLDSAPGLLDDVRMANAALSVRDVIATPLVVREIASNESALAVKGFRDRTIPGLSSSTVALAPIVAWIEDAKAVSARPVLAGSFGALLAPGTSAPLLRSGWSAVVAMLDLYDRSTPMRAPQSDRTDAIGVALEAASDARRQRLVFLALAGWMLLAFLLQRI